MPDEDRDWTDRTDGGTLVNARTRVPLGTAVIVAVAFVGWALSISGTYYSLKAQIESVRSEVGQHSDDRDKVQDEKIAAITQDQKTIMFATCALAKQSRLLVSGCP